MRPHHVAFAVLATAVPLAAFALAPTTTPRLEAFDQARDELEHDALAIYELAGTQDSWTSDEVQAGFAILFAETAKFARVSRALLEDAEDELAGGGTPPDPPIDPDPPTDPDPPGDLWTPSGPSPALVQHPDIPFPEPAPEELAGFELGDTSKNSDPRAGEPILGWNASALVTIPDAWSGERAIVWNNTKPGWGGAGDRGPLWGRRGYNMAGTLENLVQRRVGNWTKGKEGHALYLNPAGDVLIRNVHAIECGAQWGQFAWRPKETRLPLELWPLNTGAVLRIEDSSAIDCGAINAGDAVRASWPLAFYATGHELEVVRFKVRTKLPPFTQNGNPGRQAHGAVFVGPGTSSRINYSGPDAVEYAGDTVRYTATGSNGSDSFQVYARTPKATLEGLDIELWNSDREEVRLWNVGEALLIAPRIVEHGGTADVVIVDDCGRVEIRDAVTELRVRIKSAATPYGPTTASYKVAAGDSFVWPLN